MNIKKAWSPTIVVPRFRGLRIACIFEPTTLKPTPNINILLCCVRFFKARVCAYTYTQKTYPNWHKRDNLYPVGHLSLLSPEDALESCEVSKTSEQSVNKRLLNMSATPADDAQTSPAWNCGCKYTTFFRDMQIKMEK